VRAGVAGTRFDDETGDATQNDRARVGAERSRRRREEEKMIRSLLVLLVVGVLGLAVLGILFSVMVPLAILAIKVAVVLLLGYFILRLVRPDLAEKYRSRLQDGWGS